MTNYENMVTDLTPEKLAKVIIGHCRLCAYSRDNNSNRGRWDLCPMNCEAGIRSYLDAPYMPPEEDA